MFARTEVQSRWWRLFAIASVLFAAPMLFRAGSTTEWLRSAAGVVALVGITGYAFGFRVGPPLFWRIFSAIFMIALMIRLGKVAAPTFQDFPNASANGAHRPVILIVGFTLLIAVCLALFRHAGLVPSPTPAKPGSAPEPLFPSRQEQRERAHQAMATARAKWEAPMSPAKQAEARSFGPGRQLSFQQHQRIAAIMFFGTVAAQLALALTSGTSWVLMPALVLTAGSAATTYFSAETILKRQSLIALSWKAVGILAVLAVGSFFPNFVPVKLWFFSVLFADITALALGDLLVVSLYAISRRR